SVNSSLRAAASSSPSVQPPSPLRLFLWAGAEGGHPHSGVSLGRRECLGGWGVGGSCWGGVVGGAPSSLGSRHTGPRGENEGGVVRSRQYVAPSSFSFSLIPIRERCRPERPSRPPSDADRTDHRSQERVTCFTRVTLDPFATP